MRFVETAVASAWVIEPERHEDDRGLRRTIEWYRTNDCTPEEVSHT